jgi:hypothetical protein
MVLLGLLVQQELLALKDRKVILVLLVHKVLLVKTVLLVQQVL